MCSPQTSLDSKKRSSEQQQQQLVSRNSRTEQNRGCLWFWSGFDWGNFWVIRFQIIEVQGLVVAQEKTGPKSPSGRPRTSRFFPDARAENGIEGLSGRGRKKKKKERRWWFGEDKEKEERERRERRWRPQLSKAWWLHFTKSQVASQWEMDTWQA